MLLKRFAGKDLPAALALRYALAPACVLLAVALHLSPAGGVFHPAGLLTLAVAAAAWFGGVGPGFVAALIATFTLPQLIATNDPLLGGFLDLPPLATFSILGLAIGWGASRGARKLSEQERYARAMEASDDGFWDWSPANHTIYVSPRLLEIYGFAPGTKFSGRDDFEGRIPLDSADHLRMTRAIAEHFAGKTARFDMQIRFTRDGETRWAHIVGVTARDSSGAMIRWTGTVREITEQKRVEQALRESENRFARAVAGSSDGVWDIDFVGRTVYFSPRTRELCGLSPGPELVPLEGWFEKLPLHPEDQPRRVASLNAHLSGKAPAYDGEFRFLQPDGAYRWRHLHGVCVRDADGKPLRMAGSMSDVDARRRAEDALRESEQRYELAMAASESGYWDWHIPTDRYFVSPRAYELGGYPPGTTWVSRDEFTAGSNMHPEDVPKWEAARQELFGGSGERLSMEVRYIVRDETRWHMLHAICKRDNAGKVMRWSGSATDITERKRTEEDLRRSEARKAAILESALDCIVTINHEGRITEFNPAAERTFGYRRDDVLGRRLADVIIPPSLRAGHERGLARYLVTGETRVIGRRIEVTALRANGSEFPAELAITRIPLDGPPSFTGYLRDITDRKQAEDELRRSEAFLAEGQHLSRTGSFSWRVATGEIVWSQQLYRIFGFDPGTPVTLELIARRVHPEDVPVFTDIIDAAARVGRDFDIEHRLLMPDRSVKFLHVIAHATRGKDGGPEYIGAVQDVTERRLSEDALGKARSDLTRVARVTSFGALTASIAHEVNQPLSGIVTNASTCLRLLAAEPPNIEAAMETARRTIRDGRRASDVVTRLRSLFGNKEPAAEPVDLNDAAREVIALVSSDLKRNRVVLRLELADDLPSVTGDRVQLQQVILNLIRNGADAMSGVEDRPRQLTVRTHPDEEDRVRLTVQDSGVGFGPEVMERLFDPFYTTKSDGMGIGLSVSRFIIERHRGRLWAAANGHSPGATFCFSIPREALRGMACSTAEKTRDGSIEGGASSRLPPLLSD